MHVPRTTGYSDYFSTSCPGCIERVPVLNVPHYAYGYVDYENGLSSCHVSTGNHSFAKRLFEQNNISNQ
jgi:hypothetical protein